MPSKNWNPQTHYNWFVDTMVQPKCPIHTVLSIWLYVCLSVTVFSQDQQITFFCFFIHRLIIIDLWTLWFNQSVQFIQFCPSNCMCVCLWQCFLRIDRSLFSVFCLKLGFSKLMKVIVWKGKRERWVFEFLRKVHILLKVVEMGHFWAHVFSKYAD